MTSEKSRAHRVLQLDAGAFSKVRVGHFGEENQVKCNVLVHK